ncbi:MAG: NAD-binding protein, partial [Mycobacterium sp.]|nr:NAD-binding protein [Mycobacterium sp.]
MKVAIAGAGAVGRSIARELLESGHQVCLIERNPEHVDVDAIPSAHWLLGDACELSLLESAHLEDFDVVIAATGVLHHPNVPDLPGLDSFAGAAFHSARWDHDVPIDGRRVGVIGTGSSA